MYNKVIFILAVLFIQIYTIDLDSAGQPIDRNYARANGYRLIAFSETNHRWLTQKEVCTSIHN